jgi:hypothetical protein
MFFFEKKNQKTFTNRASLYPERPKPSNQEFFASFFQKRRPCFASDRPHATGLEESGDNA